MGDEQSMLIFKHTKDTFLSMCVCCETSSSFDTPMQSIERKTKTERKREMKIESKWSEQDEWAKTNSRKFEIKQFQENA